ncbi:MAG TPA: hypothetical protein PKO09_14520 [Anaerolineae bacterium]|nr:hypothetical protein [Anaerolineae bacterium]
MRYGEVLSRAWQITRKWKLLWVLGFLAGAGASALSGTNVYQYSGRDIAGWGWDPSSWPIAPAWLALIAAAVILLALAFGVLSVIATGGLIGGVQQIEESGSTTLRSAWRVGVRHFWRLLGIALVTQAPVALAATGAALLFVLGLVPVTSSMDMTGGEGIAGAISVACGGLLCCALIPISIGLAILAVLAQRAAVLEGTPWLEAIGRGWRVLRARMGPSLVLWLILLGVSLGVGLVLGLVALPILAALASLFNVSGATAAFVALAVISGIITFLVFALVESIVTTLTSAAWTLAYRALTGAEGAASEDSAEPLPAP